MPSAASECGAILLFLLLEECEKSLLGPFSADVPDDVLLLLAVWFFVSVE